MLGIVEVWGQWGKQATVGGWASWAGLYASIKRCNEEGVSQTPLFPKGVRPSFLHPLRKI